MKNRVLIVAFLFFANLVCINLNGVPPKSGGPDGKNHRRNHSCEECIKFLDDFLGRIEIAVRTGVLNLDLSDSKGIENGLMVAELTEVWHLIVNANRISTIKTLSFKNNNLTSVPDTIVELTSLEVLDLQNNPKLKTLPECLGEMENLKKIYITGTKIQLLPLSDEIRSKCKA